MIKITDTDKFPELDIGNLIRYVLPTKSERLTEFGIDCSAILTCS